MPELPEVDALAGILREALVGRAVERVDVLSISALKTFDPPVTALVGHRFVDVRRIGKQLDLVLDNDLHVVVHLMRAGWIRLYEFVDDKPVRPGRGPLAVRFRLEGGGAFDITDAAKQKKVSVSVVHTPDEVATIAKLGVEPLSDAFSADALSALIDENARRQIKGLLRDQSVIAGIGNAYSDEILHAAKLSPFALAGSLDGEARAALHGTIVNVLTTAVAAADGLEPGRLKDGKRSSMNVHGRTGEPCPVCGDTVAEVSFSDSSLQYCPTCQTGGKPLKDRRMSKLLK